MTYLETLEYLLCLSQKGSVPGLERIRELLRLLGDPQDDLKVIHVTGTNGKGSFCAMLSSVLRSGGYNVACFCSPYLNKPEEMFLYNGVSVSETVFALYASMVKEHNHKINATEYECLTALAFLYVSRLKPDVVILECCMGGLTDTTNVISDPVLSVITSVSLDHTAFLGTTVAEIAYQKAGIIKADRPVIAFDCPTEAKKVIKDTASVLHSDYYFPDTFPEKTRLSLEGSTFDYCGMKDIRLPFCASYQIKNAISVIECVKLLKNEGLNITENALRRGLSTAVWQGRFEILSIEPLIIFDGCHNVHGVMEVSRTLEVLFGKAKLIMISAMMRDKDYKAAADIMSTHAQSVYTVLADNKRALDPDVYAQVYSEIGVRATSCVDVSSAIKNALEENKRTGSPILIFGSLYMYKQVKKEIEKITLK